MRRGLQFLSQEPINWAVLKPLQQIQQHMMSNSSRFARSPGPRCRLPRQQSGLSLIELMLAVAIVSILSGIAVSMYQGYVAEARLNTVVRELRTIAVILDDALRDGGLPDTLDQIGAAMDDPWGNPYQYLRIEGGGAPPGHRRKLYAEVPLNLDYDLYSMGPDGESRAPLTAAQSRDDIVRAHQGDFYGPAEDL